MSPTMSGASGAPRIPSAHAVIARTMSRPCWPRVSTGSADPDSSRQSKLTSVSLRSVVRGTSRAVVRPIASSGAASGTVKWTLWRRRNVVLSRYSRASTRRCTQSGWASSNRMVSRPATSPSSAPRAPPAATARSSRSLRRGDAIRPADARSSAGRYTGARTSRAHLGDTLPSVSSVFEILKADGFEEVAFFHDSPTGLRAIVAIHSTALGPALGGTRFYPYASEDEAVMDVCRLAQGMTYKHAVCGNDQGGGKAVIIGDPTRDRSEALLRAYGRFVEGLSGRYITAEDVGTSQADMDLIRRETRHVTGVSESLGGSGTRRRPRPGACCGP